MTTCLPTPPWPVFHVFEVHVHWTDQDSSKHHKLHFHLLSFSEKSSFVKEQNLATLSKTHWTRMMLELEGDDRDTPDVSITLSL